MWLCHFYRKFFAPPTPDKGMASRFTLTFYRKFFMEKRLVYGLFSGFSDKNKFPIINVIGNFR